MWQPRRRRQRRQRQRRPRSAKHVHTNELCSCVYVCVCVAVRVCVCVCRVSICGKVLVNSIFRRPFHSLAYRARTCNRTHTLVYRRCVHRRACTMCVCVCVCCACVWRIICIATEMLFGAVLPPVRASCMQRARARARVALRVHHAKHTQHTHVRSRGAEYCTQTKTTRPLEPRATRAIRYSSDTDYT